MIKSALQYLVGLKPVENIVIANRQYTDREIYPVAEHLAQPLQMSTLTGIKDYLESNLDGVQTGEIMLHVADFQTVRIMGPIFGDFRQREILAVANAHDCEFKFGRHLEREEFQVGLLANFAPTPMRDDVLRYVSGIVQSAEVRTADDGISQRVTAKAGIARIAEVDLPNPVTLKPYRTFPEAEQPESDFVFRVKSFDDDRNDKTDIKAALFEADGRAWELKAALNIKHWLEENISGVRVIV